MVEDHMASGGQKDSPVTVGSDMAVQIKTVLEGMGVKASPAEPKGEALPSGTARGAVGSPNLKDIRFDPRGGHVRDMLKIGR